MKVLLVNGSPNKAGCTYTALSEVADTLHKEGTETEIFWIRNKPIAGCIACHSCERTGRGFVKNDKVEEFLTLARQADGFIFGSPVYYASANGSLTAFMDRAFISELAGNENRAFFLKPTAAVVSARRAGTT